MGKYKSHFFMAIFIFTAIVLGVGIWNNYRPQVVYASCADIAQKTTFLVKKKEISEVNEEKTFEEVLNDCLLDAGYFGE